MCLWVHGGLSKRHGFVMGRTWKQGIISRILEIGMGLVLAGTVGCGGVPVWMRSAPDTVVYEYLQAVETQDYDTAWEFLSEQTRRDLDAKAAEFNAMPDHGVTVTGREMLRFGHVLSSTREYKKIAVASANDTVAEVEIILHDASKIPVTLHRESNRWAVNLPINGDVK